MHTQNENDSMARKCKAELKALLFDSMMVDDRGAFEKNQLRYIRNIVMQSVAEEMKKVYEGVPEINPDGSLRSLNLPGLFDMLKRGKTPYLVNLVSAMITTPHRVKEDARLSRVLARMDSGITGWTFMPRARKGRPPPVPWDRVRTPSCPLFFLFQFYMSEIKMCAYFRTKLCLSLRRERPSKKSLLWSF